MIRVAFSPHPLLLVTMVVAVCAAIPHAVMAIDLSRLYGHISSKRTGKFFPKIFRSINYIITDGIGIFCLIWMFHKNVEIFKK